MRPFLFWWQFKCIVFGIIKERTQHRKCKQKLLISRLLNFNLPNLLIFTQPSVACFQCRLMQFFTYNLSYIYLHIYGYLTTFLRFILIYFIFHIQHGREKRWNSFVVSLPDWYTSEHWSNYSDYFHFLVYTSLIFAFLL